MKILALGCSFAAGSELVNPRDSAWPNVLGKMLEADVVNESENGGSNEMIFRKAIVETVTNKYDLVVIGWTEPHRFEVYLNESMVVEHRNRKEGPLSLNINWATKEFPWLKEYYAKHYNEEYFVEVWLTQVVAVQNHLKQLGIPYVFFHALNTHQLLRKHTDLFFKYKDQIDANNFLGWPYDGMVEWVYGTPHGKYGHPLEDGHRITAEKIYEHIRN